MPCYYPISGFISQVYGFRKHEFPNSRPMTVSCGRCIGCRLKKSVEWAVRISHEASLYSSNSFITLTYAPEHVPSDMSLNYVHFQEFMKRLRERCRGSDLVTHPFAGLPDGKHGRFFPDFYRPIRFYMCGEYGENFGRPHFHACLFNLDFHDKKYFKKTSSGSIIYTSKLLSDLWPYGFSSTGDVTFESAAYVARYVTKKITGPIADDHYEWFDSETGLVSWRTPEFSHMSLKPGIAYSWIKKYMADVYPHDFVVLKGKKRTPPRYYDRIYEKFDVSESQITFEPSYNPITGKCGVIPDMTTYSPLVEALKIDRSLLARDYLFDNTPERRKVKELVTIANYSRFNRGLI